MMWHDICLNLAAIIATVLLGGLSLGVNAACVVPTGLDGLDLANLNLPEAAYFQLVGASFPQLVKHETPIQFEIVQVGAITLYNTAAAYHPTSLDMFGRPISYRFCQGQPNQEYFDLHRRIALVYSMYFNTMKGTEEAADLLMQSFNLPLDVCEELEGCDDLSTPWGLATYLSQMRLDWQSRNGWNADGSLTQQYFRIPYQDWMKPPYKPKNPNNPDTWKPLVSHNGLGYVVQHHHVTPHIGQRARSIVFSDKYLCSVKAPKPKNVRKAWLYRTANRTASLNDFTKMQGEMFDNKFASLLPLQVQYFVRKNVSLESFEFIQSDCMTISMLYEATIVAWKEKIVYSRVRPTTAIQDELANTLITAYAGPGNGAKQMKGKDFQTYLRTMPHAEYPSGSSCVCEGFATVMQELEGTDDILSKIQGPLVSVYPKGSSVVEPGITPLEDITLTFSSWSEISNRCAQSRLDTGVHFDHSIPTGKALCGPIGTKVVQYYRKLELGIPPATGAAPFDAPITKGDRCPPPKKKNNKKK